MAASASTLRAIADELDVLRAHAHDLAPVVAAGVAAAPAHFEDAQRIDVMEQSLAALAALVRDLATGCELDEAISRIVLADVAARLSSSTGAAPLRRFASADVELF